MQGTALIRPGRVRAAVRLTPLNGRFDESRRRGWQVSDHCQRRDSGDVVTGPWHPVGFLRGPLTLACLVSETMLRGHNSALTRARARVHSSERYRDMYYGSGK